VDEDEDELEPLIRWWRAQDERFGHVEPFWWGAVVSDARFPRIQEANYARIETRQRVRLGEIDEPLAAAMRTSARGRSHVVVFFPDDQIDLLVEASTRGERLSWELVMRHASAPPEPQVRVDELEPSDGAFEPAYRATLPSFGVDDPEVVEQIVAVERTVMLPAGRRWFAIREREAAVALAGLLVLDGVGYVDHVATLAHARRRGYATAVVSRELAAARADGARETYLLAEPDSAAADLYARIGFRPVTQLASWIGEPSPAGG
jgi:ribosomal protein S18 acetylase RimI-like enzyme